MHSAVLYYIIGNYVYNLEMRKDFLNRTALWESLVGKSHGKASRENKKPLDQPNGKIDSAPNAREKSARACPHWRRR